MLCLVADLILEDAADEASALTDQQYRRAGEELLIEDEMITGGRTTCTRIKISVRTVVSTITKMPERKTVYQMPTMESFLESVQKCL